MKKEIKKENENQFIVKFETNTKALIEEVKKAEAIDLTNLEEVIAKRKEFVKLRTTITNREAELKSEANAFRNAVTEKRKEYLAIITPTEEKLKAIEKAEEERIKEEEQLKKLPERKERLKGINDNIEVDDSILLKMDSIEFESYFNTRVADKNEVDRIALENKARKEAQEKADILEKERLEFEKEKERLAKEKADFEALKNDKGEPSVTEITPETEQNAPQGEESTEEIKDVESKEEVAVREKYAEWLKANGYRNSTKDNFIQRKNQETGNWELFRKVAEFKG